MHSQPPKTSLARCSRRALSLVALLALAACGNDGDANDSTRGDDGTAGGRSSGLPAPEGAIGSVTGMPAHPGPGTSRITPVDASGAAQDAWTDGRRDGGEGDAEFGASDGDAPPPDPPAPMPVPEPPAVPVIVLDTELPELPEAPEPPEPPEPVPPPPEPIGTEAATESTTFTVDPEEPDGR